ncbi:MAG: metallophosphoesterase [Synergistaceae bacterium]|nr:metallophosphoesterase [Synergistaceae bacterium]MBQ3397275.1 metallophosphoesterase [Synergistaceae bacterium]MBQ4401793.1 metallophosphoesterase [Synergistaceae bacterium]
MFNPFVLVPCVICLYTVLSMVIPLRVPAVAKLLLALLTVSGVAKLFLLRMTPSGFDIYELPRNIALLLSAMFSFMIAAAIICVVKDIAFVLWKIFSRAKFPAHYASLSVLIVAAMTTIYGVYAGTRVPDVVEYDVKISGLGKNLDGMKIAMLVDIHVGSVNRRPFVQEVVDKTNALNPDLILIPGDFVDGHVSKRSGDLEPLTQLRSKYGVYAVTGNHEYYYDLQGWLETLAGFGIKWLENEHVVIASGDSRLVIAGVPDPTGGNHDTPRALNGAPENVPVILMDHQPRFARENAKLNIALQISGHTHGGQMPVVYELTRKFNGGFVRGWYDIDGMRLYVSPGTSQWDGFPMRVFDPSEITLFTLRAE